MFASIALYSWPAILTVLSSRLSYPLLLIVAIVAGYLLLPSGTGLDLPLLPPLTKETIPALTVLFLALVTGAGGSADRPGWLPTQKIALALVVLVVAAGVLSTLTNRDTLVYGPTVLPAMKPRDAGAAFLVAVVSLLPLILGRKLLAHPDRHKLLLATLAVAGFAYAFLALYEIRMSPQLNRIVYGFFPHSWAQHLRSDGFRPLVFLHHGLWLAIFFSVATLAAFGTARISAGRRRQLFLGAGSFILLTLALSNSLGGLVVTLLVLPMVLLLGPRTQLLLAAAVAAAVMTYPMLRSNGLVPVDRLHAAVSSINTARAASLGFRLRNEDILLEKALRKPLFGWGGWGRNLVFDDETGAETSVPDGYWIITLGKGGWALYVGEFGLLGLPLILCWLQMRRHGYGPETAVLALVLAANLIDLIPNGTQTPMTWLIAGALWGRIELGRIDAAAQVSPAAAPDPRLHRAKSAYVRDPATGAAAPTDGIPYTRQSLDKRHRRGGQR